LASYTETSNRAARVILAIHMKNSLLDILKIGKRYMKEERSNNENKHAQF
jgi:hypothetical protein